MEARGSLLIISIIAIAGTFLMIPITGSDLLTLQDGEVLGYNPLLLFGVPILLLMFIMFGYLGNFMYIRFIDYHIQNQNPFFHRQNSRTFLEVLIKYFILDKAIEYLTTQLKNILIDYNINSHSIIVIVSTLGVVLFIFGYSLLRPYIHLKKQDQ